MDASRRAAPWVLAAVLVLTLSALFQAQRGRAPMAAAARAGHGDLALYREVIRRVGDGERYPQAAAAHRARRDPLQPFYAVRPPTLAWIAAAVPSAILLGVAWALLAAALLPGGVVRTTTRRPRGWARCCWR